MAWSCWPPLHSCSPKQPTTYPCPPDTVGLTQQTEAPELLPVFIPTLSSCIVLSEYEESVVYVCPCITMVTLGTQTDQPLPRRAQTHLSSLKRRGVSLKQTSPCSGLGATSVLASHMTNRWKSNILYAGKGYSVCGRQYSLCGNAIY